MAICPTPTLFRTSLLYCPFSKVPRENTQDLGLLKPNPYSGKHVLDPVPVSVVGHLVHPHCLGHDLVLVDELDPLVPVVLLEGRPHRVEDRAHLGKGPLFVRVRGRAGVVETVAAAAGWSM